MLTQTVLGLVVAGTVLAAWSIPLVASTMACHKDVWPLGPSRLARKANAFCRGTIWSQDIL